MNPLTPERLAEIQHLVYKFEHFPLDANDKVMAVYVKDLLSEIKRLRGDLSAIQTGIDNEFNDGQSTKSDDLLDNFQEFVRHHKEVETERNQLRAQLSDAQAKLVRLQKRINYLEERDVEQN